MPNRDPWRGVAQPQNRSGEPLRRESRAHYRIADLLHEAEQERLVAVARRPRRPKSPRRPSAEMPRLLDAARSGLAVLARRLAITRPGRGTS
jgi:hypothetical protein